MDKLSKMGLSKDAIDQLKLMDPTQNAQVQRLLSRCDDGPDGDQQDQRPDQDRLKLGTELTTSEYNKDFQNMKDDFGQSMDDMADDFDENMERGEKAFKRGLKRNGEAFATAQSRAAAAHALALEQMDEDNERAHHSISGRPGRDGQGVHDSYVDIEKKFLQDLADLPSNLSAGHEEAITKVLKTRSTPSRRPTPGLPTPRPHRLLCRDRDRAALVARVARTCRAWMVPPAGVGHYSGNWR